jgi:hypothetical protein
MRNDGCVIKFLNKDGRVLQSFQRDKDGWFETSSNGIVRRCTAEQTLSHLLPALAGVNRAIVKVERISDKKSRTTMHKREGKFNHTSSPIYNILRGRRDETE